MRQNHRFLARVREYIATHGGRRQHVATKSQVEAMSTIGLRELVSATSAYVVMLEETLIGRKSHLEHLAASKEHYETCLRILGSYDRFSIQFYRNAMVVYVDRMELQLSGEPVDERVMRNLAKSYYDLKGGALS